MAVSEAVSEGGVSRGVAASALGPLLTGPDRSGVVLATGPRATVLSIDGGAGWRCVCLLGPGSTRLPNGIHLPAAPDGLHPGAPVTLTAGILRAGPVAVRVVRRWDSRIPPVRCSAAGPALMPSGARLGVPEAAVARLAEAITGDTPSALARAVDGLVGLGAGTTPGGDDVLAGTFAGLHAAGRPDLVGRLAAALPADLDGRTTALSADLLRLARAGEACGELLDVLRALHAAVRYPHRPGLPAAVGRLLSVGHTSGADLTAGLVLGMGQATTEEGRCLTAHTRSWSRSGEVSTTTR